ncbi:hypothetical protein Q31a_18250 [Aureliella helgolandensis]|uniref:Uncharacterized protein n=1 Tax=Aureliella helgolandensis TaxID=2527968 RepID=A0A518G4K6_9BACT|nr:hypothetical protein Q31a_18250 [Aureliella helgolandensis]
MVPSFQSQIFKPQELSESWHTCPGSLGRRPQMQAEFIARPRAGGNAAPAY